MAMSRSKRTSNQDARVFRRPDRKKADYGRFRPQAEALEERVLPAISAIFSAAAGQLRIIGDDQVNTIIVSRDEAGTLLVNNGAVAIQGDPEATVSNTRSIMITGGDGNDHLALDEQNGALPVVSIFGGAGDDFLIGGSGDDFIDGGTGNDMVFLGVGDDTFQWNPGDGSDIVDGQGGRDSMIFNGSDAAERFDFSANGIRVHFTRDVGAVAMDLNGFEEFDLNSNGGADTITVNDQSTTALNTLNLDLGGLGGFGDNQADAVIINGSDGNDIGQISSIGTRIDVTVSQIPFVHIAGEDFGVDTLTVNTLGGNDVVDATDLAATNASQLIKLTLIGGAGNDTLIGSPGADTFVWNPGDGNDTINGGDGEDTMIVDGSDVAEDFAIGASGTRVRVTHDIDGVTMDLDGVESLTVNPLGGADTVTVNDLTGTPLAEIRVNLAGTVGGLAGDGQADTVVVSGTNTPDIIPVLGRFVGANGEGVVAVDGGADVIGGLPYFLVINQTEGALDTLTVNALGGNDTVNLSDMSNANASQPIKLTVSGGAGNDTIIGSPGNDTFIWNSGDGRDTIDGRDGLDLLSVSGSDLAENFVVARNGTHVNVTDDAENVTLDLNAIDGIVLNALGGADSITVNDLTGTGLVKVQLILNGSAGCGDGQPDNVVVNGTAGDDDVRVAAVGNTILVDGLFPLVRITGVEAIDRLTVNSQGGRDVVDTSGLPAGLIGLTVDLGDGQDSAANVAPSFTKGPDQSVTDESGPQSVPGWARQISPGPPSEAGQTLRFIVLSNTDPELFAVAPTIGANGTLMFMPAPNAHGTAVVTVELQVDRGTLNGGVDVSGVQTFKIAITKIHPRHNTLRPIDVTADGHVAADDVIAIINYINSGAPSEISPSAPVQAPFVDSDGDQNVTASDAIVNINAINAGNAGDEVGIPQFAAIAADSIDLLTLLAADVAAETIRRRS